MKRIVFSNASCLLRRRREDTKAATGTPNAGGHRRARVKYPAEDRLILATVIPTHITEAVLNYPSLYLSDVDHR